MHLTQVRLTNMRGAVSKTNAIPRKAVKGSLPFNVGYQ